MLNRFEKFSASISSIYKYLQKLEKIGMERYMLKGAHTQCILTISKYDDGITAAELCSQCGKDKSAISRSIAELEELGYIERVSKTGNAYQARICLTEAGAEAARYVNETVSHVVEKAGAGLSQERRELFYSTLDLIEENMRNIYLEGTL